MSYHTILSKYFSFVEFRPGQLETILAIDEGRDVFTVLPTSTGKTLIFQFMTILHRLRSSTSTTIVISPLVSLMMDQVQSWNDKFTLVESDGTIRKRRPEDGIDHPVAVVLGSLQSDPLVEPQAVSGRFPVVYMAPEKIPHLSRKILEHTKLLVIDECHCISEHGKSFRPVYRNIRSFFKNVQTLALTATACTQIEKDILNNLEFRTPAVFRTSMLRPNLKLMVRSKHLQRSQDIKYIRDTFDTVCSGERCVVFCTTRSECESVSKLLGPSSLAYHGGMSKEERQKVLEQFGDGYILAATNCFGLGIDIPNIRLIFHYGLPRSILGYVQECGRAGRDGKMSTCIMMYNTTDISKYNDKQRDLWLARRVLTFAKNTHMCRHLQLLCMFGENVPKTTACIWKSNDGTMTAGQGCDVCGPKEKPCLNISNVNEDDMWILVASINDTGNYAGKGLPIDFLLGSKSKKLRRFVHNNNHNVYGKGKHHNRAFWISVYDHLIVQKIVKEIITPKGYVIYKLTKSGRTFLNTRTI
ncbi:RecQ family ATP-dependent DNA helicase [Gammaproteobacteria bacterium]|nr:RecQ family ATP-dependent DNA helicase [Gammaproteobacteria bacterium]